MDSELKLVITLPGLPKMANGGHGHWRKDWAEKKLWQDLMALQLKKHAPPAPFKKIKVKFIRFSSSEPDYDGLVHGFKPIRDSLKRLGFVIDDKTRNIEALYLWDKAPPKKGYIQLEIELPDIHSSDMTL